MIVGRSLRADEAQSLQAGGSALPALINTWVADEGFSRMARDWISTKLKASGKRADINLELPGNLAAYLVRNQRPHSELLTADYCISDTGTKITCDTGAPFAAGVVATRAYLSNNASRFNLKRARTLLRTFACDDYPLGPLQQPRLPPESLIPLFQQDKAEGATGTFGNGEACYRCHSQFGAHAQPFVKFNADGRWIADATGQQLVNGEQGTAGNGLYASHMIQPEAARSEASQVFGMQVQNLAGMTQAFAQSPSFLSCSAGSLMGYAFNLSDATVFNLPTDVLDDAVTAAKLKSADPTLAQLAVEIFSHPAVVRSFDNAQ